MLTVLHTNDFHGTLNEERATFLRELKGVGALYLDSGDCISAGNLAIPLKPDKAWKHLAMAGCDGGTIGNRESHVIESAFKAKLSGASHPLICANLFTRNGQRPLPEYLVLELAGFKVGIVGVMVPMVTENMASRHASAFVWEQPIPAASRVAEAIRHDVDCLIALTHIGYKQDLTLASSCPHFDLILGGHSHTVLEQPDKIGDTFVCQGGSHGRFVGRYVWTGRGTMSEARLIPLPDSR